MEVSLFNDAITLAKKENFHVEPTATRLSNTGSCFTSRNTKAALHAYR